MLECGCCGTGFRGNQHWNDDRGYGTCEACKKWIGERDKRAVDGMIQTLREALNERNRATFDAMDRALQQAFVGKAIADGILTFSIRGRS